MSGRTVRCDDMRHREGENNDEQMKCICKGVSQRRSFTSQTAAVFVAVPKDSPDVSPLSPPFP